MLYHTPSYRKSQIFFALFSKYEEKREKLKKNHFFAIFDLTSEKDGVIIYGVPK